MRSIIIAGLFWMVFVAGLVAQSHSIPFVDGEKLFYTVSYNWHFVWVEAGKVSFEVQKEKVDEKPVYRFKSEGRSIIAYDWIYKVREKFESVADARTFSPIYFVRKSLEGSYFANERIDFDYKNSKIYCETENTDKPLTRKSLDLKDFVLDVQTAVYYARTLDYTGMFIGGKIPFRLMIDGEIHDLYGKYLGIEIIENYDGKIYRCHKFSTLLVKGTIFSGGEDLFVWITDDKNKIPILVEAKILVGSVKAYFTGGKNLAFPVTSIVK